MTRRLVYWILLLLTVMLWRPFPLHAQAEACPAKVYYAQHGQDVGDCSNDTTALCQSHEYALAQGKAICSSEVQVFGDGFLSEVYRPVDAGVQGPIDLAVATVYWSVPLLVGGVGGWLAARALNRRATPNRAATDAAQNQGRGQHETPTSV